MSLTVYKRGNLRQITGLPLPAGPSFTIAQYPFAYQMSRPKTGDRICDASGTWWTVTVVSDLVGGNWTVTASADEST